MLINTMPARCYFACLLLCLFCGCGGGGGAGAGQSFQVTRPTNDAKGAADFSFDDPSFAGHIVIQIEFNDAVDENTVTVGKTLLLDTPLDHQAGGTLSWPNSKTLIFTTAKTRKELLPQGGPDAGFTLSLLGTDKGNGVIKASNGTVLDGDKDGTPGGDHKNSFLLPG